MKGKLAAYIAGIGIITAGTFGMGVYFSNEIKQVYGGLQKSVSCFYSPEDCATRDKIKQLYALSEDKYPGKIKTPSKEDKAKTIEEITKTFPQKPIKVDPKQPDIFFQQYKDKKVIYIIIPIDTLVQGLKSGIPSNYQPFAKFCIEKILEEGKRKLERGFRDTRESIDGAINSTKNTVLEKVKDYRKRLSDAIYPNYQNKQGNKLDGGG